MDEEELDLMEYLPEYLRGYQELKEIMNTENIELRNIEKRHQQFIEERFLTSCSSYGMSRYERMLGITPLADDSLETRRFRILSKWNTANPYNYAFLEHQLKTLCGEGGYHLFLDFTGQAVEIKVELTSKNMLDSVKEMVSVIVPCNLLVTVGLLYNQHKRISQFRHSQLAKYTYNQLRNEVVS